MGNIENGCYFITTEIYNVNFSDLEEIYKHLAPVKRDRTWTSPNTGKS